jgi:hypothetical protein
MAVADFFSWNFNVYHHIWTKDEKIGPTIGWTVRLTRGGFAIRSAVMFAE